MTKADLVHQVELLADDALVVVAGYGRLAAVTHAWASDGDRVVVLYVEGGDALQGQASTGGGEPSVAPQTPCAGPVPQVREAVAEGTREPLALQAGLFGEA